MSASQHVASRQNKTTGQTSNRTPTAADLDFPTFGRLVEQEARDLSERARAVNEGVIGLTADYEWAGASTHGGGAAGQSSVEPLVAEINAIGVKAFQLGRHVRTLSDFRDADLAVRAAIETDI